MSVSYITSQPLLYYEIEVLQILKTVQCATQMADPVHHAYFKVII